MGESFKGKVEITQGGRFGIIYPRIILDAGVSGEVGSNNSQVSVLDSSVNPKPSIFLNGAGRVILLKNISGKDSIMLDGGRGDMNMFDVDGKRSLAIVGKGIDGKSTGMLIGAHPRDSSSGAKAGYIEIRSSSGNQSMILNGTDSSVWINNQAGENKIILDGAAGDIILANADCAEDFDISNSEDIEAGSVMIIEQEGKLRQSEMAYDRRVAGVISGAGNYKPGLVLDKKQSHECRKSISLVGKVFCKVDAGTSSIEVGDLLTTSSTPGHAMKATEPLKAFGAVIGKALSPLKKGKGLIPILIALQ